MYGDTVTIQRGTPTTDRFGNATLTWADYLTNVPAVVQPAGSQEQIVDRDTIVTRYRMHCAPDVDVTSRDRVVWRGKTLAVDGDVELHSRKGAAHHLEMFLRGVTGG